MDTAKSICTHPGCMRLTRAGKCDDHRCADLCAIVRVKDIFYSSKRWFRVRDAWRAANPLCALCERRGAMRPMEHVDHIVPRSVAPERSLDASNLQSLCRKCHEQKTAMEYSVRGG